MQTVWLKSLLIYGLAIVVSMLIAVVIKGIVVGINVFKRAPAGPVPPAVAGRVATDQEASSDDVAADHVAAIAAAVYMTIGEHRIVRIEAGQRSGEWVSGGRAAHHASHDVAHHPRR